MEIKLQLGQLHFEVDHLSGKSVAILQPVISLCIDMHRNSKSLY